MAAGATDGRGVDDGLGALDALGPGDAYGAADPLGALDAGDSDGFGLAAIQNVPSSVHQPARPFLSTPGTSAFVGGGV